MSYFSDICLTNRGMRGSATSYGLRLVLLSALILLGGCALFSGKPSLPRHASIERLEKPVTNFAPLVADAEVVYFPGNRTASGARSEPAALLLEALEQTGKPLAIGWDLIDASQQPLLDQIQAQPNEQREELITRLEIIGSGRAREHCREVLRRAPAGIRQLALRCPPSLIVKLASGEAPTAEEEKSLPRGYRTPPGGFESYAERVITGHGVNNATVAEAYRALLLSQQFIAERIVRHFREVGDASKLLVFLGPSELDEGRGVPAYVAQKLRLRQLILGSDMPNESRTKLLTWQNEPSRPGFQVVDRAPISARN